MEAACITYLSGSRASLVSVAGFTPTAHNTLTGRSDPSCHPADVIDIDSSEFTGILTGVAEVQAALAILDTSSGIGGYKTDWLVTDGLSKAITHNLNTNDIRVEIYDTVTGATIGGVDRVRTSVNILTLTASVNPPNTWRVMITTI